MMMAIISRKQEIIPNLQNVPGGACPPPSPWGSMPPFFLAEHGPPLLPVTLVMYMSLTSGIGKIYSMNCS